MQCTAEEIEEKRRQAKLRLDKNNKLGSPAASSPLIRNQSSSFTANGRKLLMDNSSSVKVLYQSPMKNGNSPKNFNKPYDKPTVEFYGNDKTRVVKCSLITEDRFTVEMSQFDPEIVNIMKTLPTRSYGIVILLYRADCIKKINCLQLVQQKTGTFI